MAKIIPFRVSKNKELRTDDRGCLIDELFMEEGIFINNPVRIYENGIENNDRFYCFSNTYNLIQTTIINCCATSKTYTVHYEFYLGDVAVPTFKLDVFVENIDINQRINIIDTVDNAICKILFHMDRYILKQKESKKNKEEE